MMMPKFNFSLSKTSASKAKTTLRTNATSATTRTMLLFLLFSTLCLNFICAERDFNINESQVPLLEPKDEPKHIRLQQQQLVHPYAAEVERCHAADSKIMLSLVLKNQDWHELNDNKRITALNKISTFFAIPKEFVQMESVTKHDLYEMQKQSIRKGNTKCHSSKNNVGRVNLMLGCGSSYLTMGEPIVNQIGAQMKDGSIDNIVGEQFGCWMIWRKQPHLGLQRHRRQVEGSGEDEYDDYDYEDDFDEEENTEAATEIPTTPTHAHRHHHGVSQPELTASKVELTNSKQQQSLDEVAAVPAAPIQTQKVSSSNNDNKNIVVNNIADNDDDVDQTDEDEDDESEAESEAEAVASHKLLPDKKGTTNNIAEEIVESVSQLESVITKTIENTKHLKELPVIVEEEEEEEPTDVEANNAIQSVAEIEHELEEELQNELSHTSTPPQQNGAKFSAALAGTSVDAELVATTATPISIAAIASSSVYSTTTSSATPQPSPVTIDFDNVKMFAAAAAAASNVDTASSSATITATNTSPLSTLLTSYDTTTALPPTPSISSSANINLNNIVNNIITPSPSPPPPQSAHTPSHSPLLLYDNNSSSSSSSVVVSETSPSSTHTQSQSQSSSSVSPVISSTSTYYPLLSTSTIGPPSQPPSQPSTTIPLQQQQYHHHSSSTLLLPTMQTKGETENATSLPDINANSVNLSSLATPPIPLQPVVDVYNNNSPTTSTTPTYSISPSSSSLPTTSTSSADGVNTSPTTSDDVEPKMPNTAPIIKNRLQKIAVTSGKSLVVVLPEDVFDDAEDGTNLRLELTDRDGHELKPNSWLQFNAQDREIYGLTVDDTVSKYQYLLTATDSGNLSVSDTLDISVQQHHSVRTVNHEVSIVVKINEKNMRNIDWQMKLMSAIATTLNDGNTDAIVVREIRPAMQDPNTATFVYFNETFPTNACPEVQLNNLVKRLDASRLSDLVYPVLGIKSITGQLIGTCQKTQITKTKPTTYLTKNEPPVPRNQVDHVNATVGHLLVYKVRSDAFYDPNQKELKLSLKTKDNKDLSPRHWLQFDSKNNEFYGVPRSADYGQEEYMLVAEDNGGLTANDALVVSVSNPASSKEFAVYFKAYLAIRQEQFNADTQRKFVERIANYFGDQSTDLIQIRTVNPNLEIDGTIVYFYNTTLYKHRNHLCPEEQIEAVRNVFLMQDQVMRDRVKKALGPELNITGIQVMPTGACHSKNDITHREFIPTKTEEPTLKSTFANDYLYTFILPAVIIVFLIVLASIIACCLHRRRRKSGKMELGDEEERKSFRPKGIPVIFQDELEEKPEIGNKSPIILKDEKPPLLPPSYNTSNMNGDNDVDEYVPPPAVVMGGREVRGKSPATPSYRKPPPYVSP